MEIMTVERMGIKMVWETVRMNVSTQRRKLMKKVRDDEESILSILPLWGLLFLVCALFQVFVLKDRPLIQPDRQGSIVKTDQKQVYLPELIQSWFDKEDNK